MAKGLCCLFLLLPIIGYAGGFYENTSAKPYKGGVYKRSVRFTGDNSIYTQKNGIFQINGPRAGRFVCFDGRVLTCTATGYAWQAKRGCFLSRVPCKVYRANLYGVYANGSRQIHGFQRCREGYPFHLGEMQTH